MSPPPCVTNDTVVRPNPSNCDFETNPPGELDFTALPRRSNHDCDTSPVEDTAPVEGSTDQNVERKARPQASYSAVDFARSSEDDGRSGTPFVEVSVTPSPSYISLDSTSPRLLNSA